MEVSYPVSTITDQVYRLAEGPVWHTLKQRLYWVDLFDGVVYAWDATDEKVTTWTLDFRVSAIALHRDGFVLASDLGFVKVDEHYHVREVHPFPIPLQTQAHSNDGAVDRAGRFWAGTASGRHHNNHLFRLEHDGSVDVMEHHIGISNGIAWSPDNTRMYYADSPKRVNYMYDFNIETGDICNRRAFVETPDSMDTPDGLTVDEHGYVWCARWDGWCVVRYAPDGSIDRKVTLPVQRPTSCTFGGENLSQLYVTSAHINLSEVERAQQPLAGRVFCIETDTRGIAEPQFKG